MNYSLQEERNRDGSQGLCPWILLSSAKLVQGPGLGNPVLPGAKYFLGYAFCLWLVRPCRNVITWRGDQKDGIWKSAIRWTRSKRFVQIVFWIIKKRHWRGGKEISKFFRLRCTLNICWFIECERKKGSAGKGNPCVLPKGNTALLISLDSFMKHIWVLMPRHLWAWLKGHRMTSWWEQEFWAKLLTFKSQVSPYQPSDPVLGGPWETSDLLSLSFLTRWLGVVAPNVSCQFCHSYCLVPCYNIHSVGRAGIPLHPILSRLQVSQG